MSRTSRWRLRSIPPCPPTPAASACWPETRCAPRPTWAFPSSLSRWCIARDTSSSILTAPACRAKRCSPGIRRTSAPKKPARVTVSVEDRIVTVRAWRYDLKGRSGHVVPIYLLDTDLDGNSGWDRGLTDHLYGGDTNYRLQQEIVLGMGGVAHGARARLPRKRLPHERRPRRAADAGAARERSWAADRSAQPPKPTSSRCAASASSPRTRRFPPATTASPPSRPFASSAATARRALKSWAAFATAC